MSTMDNETVHNPEHNPISILRRELWNVIKNEIRPFDTTPALEETLTDLINEAARKIPVEPFTREMPRALEAKKNLTTLINSMKMKAFQKRSVLDIPDLQASLRSLCPLFPFC